jgi:hypothetical protein
VRDRIVPRYWAGSLRRRLMLLIFGVLIVAAAVAGLLLLMGVPARRRSPQLGWMSEQWLAENRTAHPSQ